jgi:hypothetical protein
MIDGPRTALDGPAVSRLSLSRLRSWVLPALGLLALALRTQLLGHASAFIDEALNVAYGRLFLASPLSPPLRDTLYWHNGWFLWPILAALADKLGGLYAVRLAAALLGALTTVLVGVLGARVFSRETGWAAAGFYALLGPPVFAASLGEYDAAAIAALAAAACVLVRAFDEDLPRQWLSGAALLFTAFLAKYVAALYFPPLVLLAAARSRRSIRCFALPLFLACAAYAATYRKVLLNVLRAVGADDARLHLSGADLWNIYFARRVDLWALVALALLWFALARADDGRVRASAAALCGLAAVMPLLHFASSSSDARFYKHAAYSMVFLAPVAAAGLRRLLTGAAFAGAAIALPVALGAAGGAFHIRQLVFWPDLMPASAWLEGKLTGSSRVLTSDLGLLHEVSPPLPFWSVTGPYSLRYQGLTGAPAYARAVDDGFFDYVVLTRPGPEEAVSGLQATVRPRLLERYAQVLHTRDPLRSRPIDVYERRAPAPQRPGGPSLDLLSQVQGKGDEVRISGQVRGAREGDRVAFEVLTDRWYPQGDPIVLASADSLFEYTVHVGQRCGALVRARLLDPAGRLVATEARAAPSPGPCP